jgi:hypothetical protein
VDAEIISKKKEPNGTYRFYVHYVDCNRRLDEWVTEDKLDLNTVRVPQRVKKSISTQSFQSPTPTSSVHEQQIGQGISMVDGHWYFIYKIIQNLVLQLKL